MNSECSQSSSWRQEYRLHVPGLHDYGRIEVVQEQVYVRGGIWFAMQVGLEKRPQFQTAQHVDGGPQAVAIEVHPVPCPCRRGQSPPHVRSWIQSLVVAKREAFREAPCLNLAAELVPLDGTEGKRKGECVNDRPVGVLGHIEDVLESTDTKLSRHVAVYGGDRLVFTRLDEKNDIDYRRLTLEVDLGI